MSTEGASAMGRKTAALTHWLARMRQLAPTRHFGWTRRVAVAQGLAVALLGVAAASARAQAQGHEHQHGAAPAAAAAAAPAAAAPATPLFTQHDLMFLTHMIVHHEQALEMAAMVPSRTNREEFIRFARYLDGAQRAEIDQMKGLLRLAADRGLDIPHHEMTGDPPMTGMLSKAQMAALAAASGRQFEKLWMEGMIYHHQGALDMAREMQERQFETGRQTFGLDVLVDDITEVQRAEINKMKMWLAQWGLS
jgi:uncharacterized protein (DUF305 family)